MNIPDMVGLVGVICYQLAYAGLQLGRFEQSDLRYIGLNILGPGCMLFSLIFHFNLASFITQVLWIVLTTMGLARILNMRRHSTATDCMNNESFSSQNSGATSCTASTRCPKKG